MKTETIIITKEKEKTGHDSLKRVYELFEEIIERLQIIEAKLGL